VIWKLFFQRLRYEIAMSTGAGLTDGFIGGMAAITSGEQDPEKLNAHMQRIIEERISLTTPVNARFVPSITLPDVIQPPVLGAGQGDQQPRRGRPPGKHDGGTQNKPEGGQQS